jgi:diguanylate cyclase (GGDEF)-like protein
MMNFLKWSKHWELEKELYKLILKGVSVTAVLMAIFDLFFNSPILALLEIIFAGVSGILLYCEVQCKLSFVFSSRVFIIFMAVPIYWNLLYNPSYVESTILFIFLPIITIILRPLKEVIFFATVFGGSFLIISFMSIGAADFTYMELFKLVSMQGLISFFVVMYVEANKEYREVISEQANELKDSNTQLEELYRAKAIEASTDPLTGLSNRLSLMKKLNELYAQYRRSRETFSIILFDIDNFKKVNDTYGHSKGDEVLQEISKIALECVRELDMVARYGGEEFLVILPKATAEVSQGVAERMRLLMQEKLVIEGKSITASFGVVQMREKIDIDKLINLADEALYRAKASGRKCVEVVPN